MVVIAGAILCLDRVAPQVMISRPIVAGPAIGILLNDPYTGLITGALIELFWIDRPPIGAYMPPNDTMAAVLIAAASIESGRLLGGPSSGLIVLAVLLYMPLSYLARRMELQLCRGNEELAEAALRHAEHGEIRAIAGLHLTAILRAYLAAAVFILVALPPGIALLTWIYPLLAEWTVRGLIMVYGILPLIGTAVALNAVKVRGAVPLFCGIFLAATVVIRLVRAGEF
jgi:mannose/fructose/N-acetylgalactosamine-specific phosphotransferase system component IIC